MPARFRVRWWWVVLASLGLASVARAGLLPHAPLIPEEYELARLARVRALMAGSTAAQPSDVRILFYGQSITLSPWWKEVARRLEAAYPTVRFQFENRAITGFIDASLERTTPADVFPRNPDLVILHAFGDGFPMAQLIREVRAATIAEVLLQQDYVLAGGSVDVVTNLHAINYANNEAFRNYISLPLAADQTGACLARIHDSWKAYCRTNHVDPKSLLNPDGLHPAPDSDELLAELTLAYLLPRGEVAGEDPVNGSKVRTLDLAGDPIWRDGELVCDVSGRTVELGLDRAPYADLDVFIDGVRPSAHPELYAFTRPSAAHLNQWPAISRVGWKTPLVEEVWTFTPFDVAADGIDFSFRVSGSVTGDDGVGRSTERFVSPSGRVVIESSDHWLGRAVSFGGGPIPAGFTASWAAVLSGMDVVPTTLRPSTQARGDRVVLAHGLSEGPHRVRLATRPGLEAPFRFLRASSPAGQARIEVASPPPPPPAGRLTAQSRNGARWLSWSRDPGWRLESTTGMGANAVWEVYPEGLIREQVDHRRALLDDTEGPIFFRLVLQQ